VNRVIRPRLDKVAYFPPTLDPSFNGASQFNSKLFFSDEYRFKSYIDSKATALAAPESSPEDEVTDNRCGDR